jgi:hypothetical protein
MSDETTPRWKPNYGQFLMRYRELDLYFHYDDETHECHTVVISQDGRTCWQKCFPVDQERVGRDSRYPGYAPHMAARKRARELRWLMDDGQAWMTGIDKVPE